MMKFAKWLQTAFKPHTDAHKLGVWLEQKLSE